MSSPSKRTPRGAEVRRRALWAGLAAGLLPLPLVGCQVEYAGMTLPSGKYMHDDVQYFPPGPEFPWANTQAAGQRARMSAMGEAYGLAPMPTIPGGQAITPPPVPGSIPPQQNLMGRPTDVNVSPFAVNPPVPPGMAPPPPAGAVPGAPAQVPAGGEVPAPGAPAPGPGEAVPAPAPAPAVPGPGEMTVPSPGPQ